MSTYKVIQDIEAEDKLLGPLTLRQLIYAGIAAVCIWLSVMAFYKGVPFMIGFLAPVALLAGFLAFPWGGDQPTEIWAVSKLRFYLKPRKRIWNQDGRRDLVTITVPKKIERQYTDGLSQGEVKSRLKALASTLDTRGWALQNQPYQIEANQQGDMLFGVSTTLPQPTIPVQMRPQDDMFDMHTNPAASHLNQLVDNATRQQRENLLAQMSNQQPFVASPSVTHPPASTNPPVSDWFSPRESTMPAAEDTTTTKATTHQKDHAKKHSKKDQTQATSTSRAAIMNLASNDDLDIATLSRQANQEKPLGEKPNDDGEVVISLR